MKMKGVKYIIAVALLLSLQAYAKRAKKVEPVQPEEPAPTMRAAEVQPGMPNCECTSPEIEMVDECVHVRKHSPDMCFKTKTEYECVRTYKINGEDESVTCVNGECQADGTCRPCKPCKPCKPCRPCRPCR